jgi:hypothetical protein
MSPNERFPICPSCNEPVNLTTSTTNADGKAVHEKCYVETIKVRPPKTDGRAAAGKRAELDATRDLDYSASPSEYERESLAAEATLRAEIRKRKAKSPRKT